MKKILILINTLNILINSTNFFISCNKKINKEINSNFTDNKGNSIFAILPILNEKINSENIWNEFTNPFTKINLKENLNYKIENWDGPTKIKIAMKIMQILSVSILANSDIFFKNNENNKNIADYSDLNEILKEQWKILNSNIEQQIINKKEKFKNEYKKKWKEEYEKWLIKNFLDNFNYIKINNNHEKWKIAENNYKSSLMLEGGENVSSAQSILISILLNNNMRQYNISNIKIITNLLSDFNEWVKNNNLPEEWNKNNINLQANLVLAYSWNFNDKNFDIDIKNKDFIKNGLKNIYKKLLEKNFQLDLFAQENKPIDSPIMKINNIDNSINGLNLNNQLFQPGLLSLFQKFFIEQWYKNEKPLAISEIKYNFKNSYNNEFDGEINIDYFEKNTLEDIKKDLNNIFENKWDWEYFYKNKSKSGIPISENELITLSNNNGIFKSNTLKANIYNNYNKENKNIDLKKINSNEELDNFFKNFNRTTDEKMSGIIKIKNNDKIIIFFDTDGLHLLHIDGNEFLNKKNTNDDYKLYNWEWQLNNIGYAHNIYENEYKKLMNDIMKDKDSNDNIKLNSHFSHIPYLQYLINMSMIKNKNKNIRINFNILKQVENYIKNTTDYNNSISVWWSWIYDFFDHIQKNIFEKYNKNWISLFINFKNNKNENINDFKWFTDIINATKNTLLGEPYNKLISSIEKENNLIEEFSDNQPQGKFNLDNIINNINNLENNLNDDKEKTKNNNIWSI